MSLFAVGYCQCGCGEPTTIAPIASSRDGILRGEPRKFVRGHRHRRIGPFYKVDRETGCWVWQRSSDRQGYGQMRHAHRLVRAHRFFYEVTRGPIPPGLPLDHLCGNRLCVNPNHLEPVTQTENTRRGRGTKIRVEDAARIKTASDGTAVLAERYGLAKSTIRNIRNGQIWADVEAAA